MATDTVGYISQFPKAVNERMESVYDHRTKGRKGKVSLLDAAVAAACLLEIKYTNKPSLSVSSKQNGKSMDSVESLEACMKKNYGSGAEEKQDKDPSPDLSWDIEFYYVKKDKLVFKLRAPEGAAMVLHGNECIECIRILLEDEDDKEHFHFRIRDAQENVIQTDRHQVEAYTLYLMAAEKKKTEILPSVSAENKTRKRKSTNFGSKCTAPFRKGSKLFRKRSWLSSKGTVG